MHGSEECTNSQESFMFEFERLRMRYGPNNENLIFFSLDLPEQKLFLCHNSVKNASLNVFCSDRRS